MTNTEPVTSVAGMLLTRSFALEDIHIQRTGDGRTVEAYCAVFDSETEIHDHEGHYIEVIDPTAFNKVIRDAAPQGPRRSWNVGVFYHHGKDLYGGASERGSVPIGVPLEIRPDSKGCLTVTRYNRNPLAEEVLEAIREGAITGQSFTGRIVRSTPSLSGSQRRRGGYQPDGNGRLQTVRRMELGLAEYGPTPLPAYRDPMLVGVRSQMTTPQIEEPVSEDTPTGAVSRHEEIVQKNRAIGVTPDEPST